MRGRGNYFTPRGFRGNQRGDFRGSHGRGSFLADGEGEETPTANSEATKYKIPTASTTKQTSNNLLTNSFTKTINKHTTSTSYTITEAIPERTHKQLQCSQYGIVPGGRLTRFLESWEQTILHPWPVSILQHGYKLQFAKTPVPWRSIPMKMSTTDKLAVNEAISKFLEAGIVERSPIQDKGFLSNFFTIQEAKKRGPILNCQKLNQFLQYEHFKMEEVPALREILEKNDYMYRIDLKDAYVMVPIHPHSRKFLTFQNEGVVYQYPSLAFGLSIAP